MTQQIIRQKTLFDDENSDELYLKEEMKRLRRKKIKEKEKDYLKRKAEENQVPLSESRRVIERDMKQYDDMILKIFGDKDVFNDWCKEILSNKKENKKER